jgi:hypothetical protein
LENKINTLYLCCSFKVARSAFVDEIMEENIDALPAIGTIVTPPAAPESISWNPPDRRMQQMQFKKDCNKV